MSQPLDDELLKKIERMVGILGDYFHANLNQRAHIRFALQDIAVGTRANAICEALALVQSRPKEHPQHVLLELAEKAAQDLGDRLLVRPGQIGQVS